MQKRKFDWVGSLKKYVENHHSRSSQQIEDQTDKLFLDYIEKSNKQMIQSDQSLSKILKFYYKSKEKQNNIGIKIRQSAIKIFIKNKALDILTKKDLQDAYFLLKQNILIPNDGKQRLDYNSFIKVASQLPPKFRQYFSASTFIKFDRYQYGRIYMQSYFHSIQRKNNLLMTRLQLSQYDTEGNGYLTEANFKAYHQQLTPSFYYLKEMNQEFKEVYVNCVLKKFYFDQKKTGKLYIKEMSMSAYLVELFNLSQGLILSINITIKLIFYFQYKCTLPSIQQIRF